MHDEFTLPMSIQSLIYRDKRKDALFKLSEIIKENEYTLYDDYMQGYSRYVARFKIRILIEWGYYREALAWACLQSELYPDDGDTKILKEKLKKKLRAVPAKQDKIEFNHWEDIAGMYELKSIIENDIILPLTDWEIYQEYNVPLPNGFLLYGPPGCGKSFFARKLANRIGFNYFEITPSDTGSTYVHGTQLKLKEVFEEARDNAPALLFVDEIDAMAPNRNNADVSHHYKAEVNEILTQLDKNNGKDLVVIAATNYLRSIDPAVLRPGRFDKKIFVGPPDYAARLEALKLYVADYPSKNIRYDYLAEMCEYYTFAELKLIVDEVKKEAIRGRDYIDTNILAKKINTFKPMLNKEEIKNFG